MSWRWERFVWWLTQPPVATPVAVLDVYAAGGFGAPTLARPWLRINGRLRRIVGADVRRHVWWIV